jgi:hypothetical protein
MPDRIFGPSIDASIAVHYYLLPHRNLEILTSIGAPVSWYCERFTSIHGQCFAKSSALACLVVLNEFSARAVQLRETTGRAAFDERVMAAMGRVPRHEFVPIEFQSFAYANIPLPIGFDKTISQPYVVSLWLLDRTHGARGKSFCEARLYRSSDLQKLTSIKNVNVRRCHFNLETQAMQTARARSHTTIARL